MENRKVTTGRDGQGEKTRTCTAPADARRNGRETEKSRAFDDITFS